MYNIFIVGLGLMGGSIAKSLKGFKGSMITGYDIDPTVLAQALDEEAIDCAAQGISSELSRADLTILCLTPKKIIDFINTYARKFKPGSIVTDIGGIKTPIMAAAQQITQAHFVGGHPMAGKEKGGYANSSDSLFKAANYVLTPGDAPSQAVNLLKDMARYIGCKKVVLTTSEQHDTQIAYTSQLMHILAAAICNDDLYEQSAGYDGNSFRGTTRVAQLDANMWAELFLLNSDPLEKTIRSLSEHLLYYADLIKAADAERLKTSLQKVSAKKQEWNMKNTNTAGADHES